MLDWLKPKEWDRRNKIRLDRKHLEARARRFLKGYLEADEAGKPQYHRAVEEISRKCQPAISLIEPGLDDARVAEATSDAAMKMVFQLTEALTKEDQPDFLADACATVAIAYRRAAGIYVHNEKMQELGTAAVHLLTMATSSMSAQSKLKGSDQSALPFVNNLEVPHRL